jgi:hypothetical protein
VKTSSVSFDGLKPSTDVDFSMNQGEGAFSSSALTARAKPTLLDLHLRTRAAFARDTSVCKGVDLTRKAGTQNSATRHRSQVSGSQSIFASLSVAD